MVRMHAGYQSNYVVSHEFISEMSRFHLSHSTRASLPSLRISCAISSNARVNTSWNLMPMAQVHNHSPYHDAHTNIHRLRRIPHSPFRSFAIAVSDYVDSTRLDSPNLARAAICYLLGLSADDPDWTCENTSAPAVQPYRQRRGQLVTLSNAKLSYGARAGSERCWCGEGRLSSPSRRGARPSSDGGGRTGARTGMARGLRRYLPWSRHRGGRPRGLLRWCRGPMG